MERQWNDASNQGEAATVTGHASEDNETRDNRRGETTHTHTHPLDRRCMPHIPHGSPIPPQRRGAKWRPNHPAPQESCISRHAHTRSAC